MIKGIKKLVKKLKKLEACEEAIEWAKQHNSMAQCWRECERGDWMLWFIGKLSGQPRSRSRKKLVLTACGCARLSLKYVPKGENSPLRAIQTAERYAQNEATLEEIRKAAYAAADAYDAYAYASYAAYDADASDAYAAAAYAAADAAAYASCASDDADAADAAAYAADASAYAAAAADAREQTLKQCADIVRKHYPTIPRF